MTKHTTTQTIPLSKGKVAFLSFLSFCFVAGGIWMFFLSAEAALPRKILMIGAGILSIVFFSICGVLLLIKLFDKRPGLIIDALGLTIYSGFTKQLHVPWADITGFPEIQNSKFILIMVLNPEEHIANCPSAFQRRLMRMNNKYYETPLNISASALKISHKELVDRLHAAWSDNR